MEITLDSPISIRKFPGNLPIDPASAASGEICELTILTLLSRVDLHSEIPQEFANGDGAVQRDLHSDIPQEFPNGDPENSSSFFQQKV